jgi:hypothetical protein
MDFIPLIRQFLRKSPANKASSTDQKHTAFIHDLASSLATSEVLAEFRQISLVRGSAA